MRTGDMDAALMRIQNDLFDLGADLCRPEMEKDAEAGIPACCAWSRRRWPAGIRDRRDERALEPLRSFILPGGSALAAHLHLCRTVCAGPNG
jgi:cob(I)alamin adenosyltransferase